MSCAQQLAVLRLSMPTPEYLMVLKVYEHWVRVGFVLLLHAWRIENWSCDLFLQVFTNGFFIAFPKIVSKFGEPVVQ